jgi:hypothetical protein
MSAKMGSRIVGSSAYFLKHPETRRQRFAPSWSDWIWLFTPSARSLCLAAAVPSIPVGNTLSKSIDYNFCARKIKSYTKDMTGSRSFTKQLC